MQSNRLTTNVGVTPLLHIFLVPPAKIRKKVRALPGDGDEITEDSIEKLASHFCVSTLTILNSLLTEELISRQKYAALYPFMREKAIAHAQESGKTSGGGDYYRPKIYALGKRFASAVFADAAMWAHHIHGSAPPTWCPQNRNLREARAEGKGSITCLLILFFSLTLTC